jgi:hypothetical protein
LVASVAWPLATVVTKRTEQLQGVGLSHDRGSSPINWQISRLKGMSGKPRPAHTARIVLWSRVPKSGILADVLVMPVVRAASHRRRPGFHANSCTMIRLRWILSRSVTRGR